MISVAVQQGDYVLAYDKHGSQILMVTGILMGFTNNSVSVKSGSYIITYDQTGRQISIVAS